MQQSIWPLDSSTTRLKCYCLPLLRLVFWFLVSVDSCYHKLCSTARTWAASLLPNFPDMWKEYSMPRMSLDYHFPSFGRMVIQKSQLGVKERKMVPRRPPMYVYSRGNVWFNHSFVFVKDVVLFRILLQSLPGECLRHSDGWLCIRKEYNWTSTRFDDIWLEHQSQEHHAWWLWLGSHGQVGLRKGKYTWHSFACIGTSAVCFVSYSPHSFHIHNTNEIGTTFRSD